MFKDREEAGYLLSEKLLDYKRKEAVILAIPRGGVPVGKIVSNKLSLPLDIVVTRKLSAPNQKELAIGAIGPNGFLVFDEKLLSRLDVKESYLEKEIKRKKKEVEKRLKKYRKGKKKISLRGRTILLVDDGVATGSTSKVAAKYLKEKGANKIILATPVIAKDSADELKNDFDEIVAIDTPLNFRAVGQYYQHFPQLSDKEVIELL